jgi:hypothetical protein
MVPSDRHREPRIWHVIGLIALVVVIWWGMGEWASKQLDPGQYGDMFGSVNALFSGLAFAGLIYALWLQRVELRLQREELEATRLELKGQKDQMEAQNQTLRKQSFENTFFQLLRLHNDIVNSIDLIEPGAGSRVTLGRDCFKVFYGRLKREYGMRTNMSLEDRPRARLMEAYNNFYAEHEAELGHYFRSLYNLIKFVKNSDADDKRLYTNLIRAQLSSYELLLIFYNCHTGLGREKLKPLAKVFDLLKHLPHDMLLEPEHASLD